MKELSEKLTEKNELCEKLISELDELKKEYETNIKNTTTRETENQKEGNLLEKEQEKEKVKSPNNIEVEAELKEKNKKEKEKDCIIF